MFELPGKRIKFDKSFLHSMMVDEKYKMLAAHVDVNMRKKIQNLEYIDLAKLLPRDRIVQEEDHRLTFINKGGQPWIVPAAECQGTDSINSYLKWHQAFRVYSDILTARFPEKATELFQYEHIIHAASQTYIWENVYSYDKAFRIHISEYPDRTWSIILHQAYTTKLKEKLRGNEQNYFARKNTRNNSPCRRFQRGKWNFGINCKYEHRCTICNKYGHGAHLCRKRSGFGGSPRSYGDQNDNRDRRLDRYHFYRSENKSEKVGRGDKRDKDKADKK